MVPVFFEASKDALDNITELFDFIHPLNISLQYTRKFVQEAFSNKPELSESEMKLLVDPNNKVHGVNYRRTFVDTPFVQQEEKLGWLLLNNLFAIHEGWIQRLYDELFYNFGYNEYRFVKRLEYTGLTRQLACYYVNLPHESVALKNAFFDSYKNNSGLDFSKLDNYMLCYRFYKEMRNCYMHHNQIAGQNVVDVYNDYCAVANLSDLDVLEVPESFVPVKGNPIKVSLRGIIGFSQIVRRIIIISDINLLCTTAGEKEFISRKPGCWSCQTLSNEQNKAIRQVCEYATRCGFLTPNWCAEYQQLLIDKNIFHR